LTLPSEDHRSLVQSRLVEQFADLLTSYACQIDDESGQARVAAVNGSTAMAWRAV
jgi:hypothetical protein